VVEVVCEGRADAVAVASVLHYQLVGTLAEDGGLAVDGNTEAARRGVVPGRISPCSIADIKAELQRSGVEVTVHHG
jgi:imidazole glycerol phosphate synthase subunit HisF